MESTVEQPATLETLAGEEELAALTLIGLAAATIPDTLERRIEGVTVTYGEQSLDDPEGEPTQDTMFEGGDFDFYNPEMEADKPCKHCKEKKCSCS